MIEGKRVNLRLFEEKDLDEYIPLLNQFTDIGPFFPIRLFSPTEVRKKFQDSGYWSDDEGHMLVTDKQGRLLGEILFFKGLVYQSGYELGYVIFRQQDRNQGYMSEALRLFSSYLFELKPIPRLQIHTAKGNQPSRRIAEKCGYQYEGTLRRVGFLRGAYVDGELFSLLREECPPLSEVLQSEKE
jgi:ribosomal-protein-alanine N-acetyltransferase